MIKDVTSDLILLTVPLVKVETVVGVPTVVLLRVTMVEVKTHKAVCVLVYVVRVSVDTLMLEIVNVLVV